MTYRNNNGKYQNIATQIGKQVPDMGESDNPKIELWRVAVNAYHDLYQNGMGNWANKKDDFEKLSSVNLSEKGTETLVNILDILPSNGDTVSCNACDGYGYYTEEEEYEYEDEDGETQYDYEETEYDCCECEDGEVDWTEDGMILEGYQIDVLIPLFETLLDSIIEYIVM